MKEQISSSGPTPEQAKAYWVANVRLMTVLLSVWFLVSYGCGILFREALDAVSIGGAPLGFWFAQNGSIYVFMALIIIYARQMAALERKYNIKG